MYKEHRGGHFDRPGGGSQFRDKGSFDRGFGRDSGRPAMHSATCAACNQACEVPFKPNGRKPVYCTNCFKKEGPTDSRGFNATEERRPSFHENREPRFGSNAVVTDQKGLEQVKKQLEMVNAKLDTLIQVLSPKPVKTEVKAIEVFETAAPEKKDAKKKKAAKKAK